MSNSKEVSEEDLAIQDTLSMTVEERLDLITQLIVDKILEDKRNDEILLRSFSEVPHG